MTCQGRKFVISCPEGNLSQDWTKFAGIKLKLEFYSMTFRVEWDSFKRPSCSREAEMEWEVGGESLKTWVLNCFCTVLGSDICPNIWFLYHFHLKSKLDFLSKQAANSSLWAFQKALQVILKIFLDLLFLLHSKLPFMTKDACLRCQQPFFFPAFQPYSVKLDQKIY